MCQLAPFVGHGPQFHVNYAADDTLFSNDHEILQIKNPASASGLLYSYIHVRISELRDGRIERIENHGAIVDSLEEPPVIHSEAIDADELSMLLDNTPQEADE